MSISNPLAWFAVCALCLALGSLLARQSPFFRERLAENAAGRYETIDGLRGFLALGVLGDHAIAMYHYHVEGLWLDEGFYQAAGYAGVSLFFAITGYLFWLRVLRGSLDTRAFFLSRLRRLVPMYAASVLAVLLVALSVTGPFLNESPVALLKDIRAWASFGFERSGPINGFADAHHINAVYWTLAYEWAFYIALPFLALFARGGAS